MKIKTLIPVTYNDGIAAQSSGIVEGEIMNCNQTYQGYNFNYKYNKDDGSILVMNVFSLSIDEINSLYSLVGGLVPDNILYTEQVNYLYYLGFRVKMAETFNISPNDIEILND